MAYSCVKVLFEIGHEASIRAKQTPEGFTHDWEVFVRGGDNSEIYHFVEKVVFYLHETFPKPKRVVKEPPYSVKESGYAGFNLPIDIYFKNSDEPKKVRYNYDLHLQPSGPPISKVLKEQFVFPNPAEDLRRKLIKGGGVGVLGSESSFHLASCDKVSTASVDESVAHKHTTPALVGKPKLSSGDSNKKHKKESKIDEPRGSNTFHDLFGPPIKTKVSPDPKKSSHSPKVSPISKPLKPTEKSSSADKVDKSSKSSKHGSQREGKESERSSSTKEEKKDKERNRDKEKSKEKVPKRPTTPVKSSSTPPKRSSTPPKRASSPSPSAGKLLAPPATTKVPTSPKHLTLAKPSKDESKKSTNEEAKNRGESKSGESGKSEKKKKEKKNRDEKTKKDKHKEHEKGSEKVNKGEKCKESKEREASKKAERDAMKEPEKSREKEKEKLKYGDGEKEKQRHKHKKKDKSNKDRDKDKEKDRDKSSKKSSESKLLEIRDKEKNGLVNDSSRGSIDTSSDVSVTHKKQAASSPSPSPGHPPVISPKKLSPTPEKAVIGALIREKIMKRPIALLSDDSSDSNSSVVSADEDLVHPISRIKLTNSGSGITPGENKSGALPGAEPARPNSQNEIIKPKSENLNQERNSLSKNSSKQKERSSKKSKERDSAAGGSGDTEKEGKKRKRKSGSRTADESEGLRNNGETPSKVPKIKVEDEGATDPDPVQEVEAAGRDIEIKEESDLEETESPGTHLTEEYVSELRELQHKIMALEDNAELQRVVQVIAETGQYEITKKTFDFDLCALDKSTVKRLQAFFTPS